MERAGMALRYDLAGRAIMGFTEVVTSFGFIRKLFYETVDRMREAPPDVLVAIDYPGFNLRLAAKAKGMGVPVVYYISPQVWAWKKGRMRVIARTVEKMLVILPFEEALYRASGVPCVYVGHPLLDHIASVRIRGIYKGGLVVGLLPGSREQEIQRILPVMLETARGLRNAYPEARFVTPCVDDERAAQIRAIAGDFPIEPAVGQTYEALAAARFCLVASGTATVEAALFGVPMIVLYKVSGVTYRIARRLVRVDAIAMVNILAGKRIVPEFIQHEAEASTILPEALDLMEDTPRRAAMIEELRRVRDLLGGPGASHRAAREVLDVAARARHG
jgi:lipid-A-disaccharide synthase